MVKSDHFQLADFQIINWYITRNYQQPYLGIIIWVVYHVSS